MAFRLAGLLAAIAMALLIAAVGAQGPQAQEKSTDLQEQATGSGQPTMLEKIVFSSTRDNPGPYKTPPGIVVQALNALEIYLMDPDGTNAQRLTNNASSETFAAVPLDGKRIVYDSNRLAKWSFTPPSQPCFPGEGAEKANTSDLFVMATDGDEADPIEETPLIRGSSATWSPDSKNIAYHASASGTEPPIFCPNPGAATFDSDIFSLNVDDRIENNAEPTNLTNNDDATIDDDADWSPDGKTIIFESFPGPADPAVLTGPGVDVPKREIYAMNADGTGKWTNLTNNNLEERGPAWSPDGSKILFICRRPSELNNSSITFEICVRDVNRDSSGNITGTSNELVLTRNEVPDGSANWSPEGDKIVFQRNDQIFVMNADGSPFEDGTKEKQLTKPPGGQFSPKWGEIRVNVQPGG